VALKLIYDYTALEFGYAHQVPVDVAQVGCRIQIGDVGMMFLKILQEMGLYATRSGGLLPEPLRVLCGEIVFIDVASQDG